MKYDCLYRSPEKCNHPKVKDTISFELDKKEQCGKCLYRKSPTKIVGNRSLKL